MRLEAFRRGMGPVIDWSIAVGLAVLGVVDVFADGTGLQGPRAGNLVFLLAISIPLAWRRRAPLAVALIVSSATAIALFAMYDLANQPPLEPFLALLVAFYSAALYGRGRRALGALAIAGGIIGLEEVAALIAGRPWGDVVPAVIFWAAAAIVGSALRHRQELAVALKRRTSQLELEQEDTARAAAAEERSRIARELHDVIAHGLSVVVIQAEAERRTLPQEQTSTREVLATIETTARESLVELRRLLGMIRKSEAEATLKPQPSLTQLPSLVEQVRNAGVDVRLHTEGEASALAPGIDLSAYRIVQEGLTNVLKHSHATTSEVIIRYRPRALEVEVNDNGRGQSGGGRNGGHGLIGMRERVEIYGGKLETGPSPSGGFRLWAQLPLGASS